MGLRNIFRGKFKLKSVSFYLLLLLILIVIGLILYLIFGTHNKVASKPVQSKNPTVTSRENISSLVKDHKYSQAETQLKALSSSQHVLGDYVALANVQVSQGKNAEAILTLKNAETRFGVNYVLSSTLGQIALLKSDNKAALVYYGDAIDSVKKDPSQVAHPDQTISSLNAIINNLKKTTP